MPPAKTTAAKTTAAAAFSAEPFPPLFPNISNYWVVYRRRDKITLGIPRSDQEKFDGAFQIDVIVSPGEPTIEVGMTLSIAHGRLETPSWSSRGGQILSCGPGALSIVPYKPHKSPTIPGLDWATSDNLVKGLGEDFFLMVAASPDVLNRFRYSPAKKEIIIRACVAEAEAVQKITAHGRCIYDNLRLVGVSRPRARYLVSRYSKSAIAETPYAPLFDGALTFKTADRFALLAAPEAAMRQRPQAILVASFRSLAEGEGHTIASEKETADRAWLDFALEKSVVADVLEGLKAQGVVVIARPGRLDKLFNVRCPAEYGLSALINAECAIAEMFRAGGKNKVALSKHARDVIESVIKHADRWLGEGFVLDADQACGLRQIFSHHVSILTGPPGSGKTAIVALANVIAVRLFGDKDPPARGVAFAGRAASVLEENASVRLASGGVLPFAAATIHRTFGLDPTADKLDWPEAKLNVSTGLFVCDETSMNDVLLLRIISDRTDARHIVFVGDADQLPPIGPGAPFIDAIDSELVPVTRLGHDYRSEAPALRKLVAAIRDGKLEDLAEHLGDGVQYIPARSSERGRAAGVLCKALIARGASPHDIAVISPANVGDDGTGKLNPDIRVELGFGPALQVGDMLMVLRNDYSAASADGPEPISIFNGERCLVARAKDGVIDAVFPASRTIAERRVRFLANGDKPPEDMGFGFAMTAHKAQGSQFKYVVLITGVGRNVAAASVYTAASRARERLIIVGDDQEFVSSVRKPRPVRRTLLSLPKGSLKKVSANG